MKRIKEQIAKTLNMHVNSVRLCFKSKELNDNQSVSDCNLYNEVTIHMVPRTLSSIVSSAEEVDLPQPQGDMCIIICDGSDSQWKFDMSPQSTVLMLRKQIEEMTSMGNFNISCNGKILTDKDTLEKCALVNNSTVNISSRFNGGFLITLLIILDHD